MSATGSDMWDDAKWNRYGYLGGVVFVVLNLVALFAPGAPPDRDANGEEITNWVVDNAGGLKLAGALTGLAIFFGLFFLGSLWRRISTLESAGPRLAVIAVAGFVIAVAALIVGQAITTAPALRPDTLAGAAELSWEMSFVLFAISLAAIAAHMVALGALILWTKFLPVWMGWIAFLSAVTALVGVISAGSDSTALSFVMFIAFLLFMLWVLLASILLYMGKGADT